MNCFEFSSVRRVRFWIEIFWMHYITNSNNYELSNFELKKSIRHILNENFYNVSSFQIESIQRVTLWIENFETSQIQKKFAYKKSHIESCFSENGIFCIFSGFSRSMILKQKIQNGLLSEIEISRLLLFDVEEYQSNTFWISKNQALCSEIVF